MAGGTLWSDERWDACDQPGAVSAWRNVNPDAHAAAVHCDTAHGGLKVQTQVPASTSSGELPLVEHIMWLLLAEARFFVRAVHRSVYEQMLRACD
jgi:hypothetical protein